MQIIIKLKEMCSLHYVPTPYSFIYEVIQPTTMILGEKIIPKREIGWVKYLNRTILGATTWVSRHH